MAQTIPDLTDKASRIEVVLFFLLTAALVGFVIFKVSQQMGTIESTSKPPVLKSS